MTNVFSLAARFFRQERGLALTEYLILLGMLVASVIASVTVFGNVLANLFWSWVAFISSL